jgi:hypothetical protein
MIYENEKFMVAHISRLNSFAVISKGSECIVTMFGYTILAFPFIFLAKRAKRKAIKFANELNKVCTP